MGSGKPDPFASLNRMQERLEELMQHLMRTAYLPAVAGRQGVWTPAVDVYETASGYVVLVELAGVERDKLDVTLSGNRLTLSGERLEPHCPDAKQRLHQMEIEYGRFERTVLLPEAPEPESVQARYENGFLRIQVSRRPGGREVKVISSRRPRE